MRSSYRLLIALTALLVAATGHAEPTRTDHAEAELHSQRDHAVPGSAFRVALRLRPDPGWHTYWRNPGDSGLPTTLEWTLPEGVEAGPIQWPWPATYRLADIVNYGYGDETLHLVDVKLPADWPAGEPVTLQAQADWLICSDICVPESATLSLEVPTATGPADIDPVWAPDFERAASRVPEPADWPAAATHDDGAIRLQVQLPDLAPLRDARFTVFPVAIELLHHSAPQRVARRGDTLWLEQAENPYFERLPAESDWVLVADTADGARAWRVTAQAGAVPAPPADAADAASGDYDAPDAAAPAHGDGSASGSGEPAASGGPGLATMLALAFGGGLLLNLMPCVFPVLAIKALSVLSARGENRAHQRLHGLVYTAGVVATCLAAAGLLLGLRAGGAALGWGFQLQSPVVIGVLAYLFFAFGLSLSGVFMLGTRVMGLGQSLTERQGLSGSFATGVLAVIVASPCTAPMMGTALGFAVTQPAIIALAIFAALGLGLAAPFLLIGLVPTLARLLPRPGAWMEHFKQAMAFPLYLSVAWLLWVLSRQAGSEALLAVMVGLVLVAFAAWLWHRPHRLVLALRVAALAGAAALLATPAMRTGATAVATGSESFESWSPERLAELRAAGDTVFVNFTADWCITCLANERTVLSRDAVRDALAADGVHYLKADWTRSDPRITEALAGFGRNGVPLYVVYHGEAEPQVLPQILGTELVLDALDR